MLKPLQHTPDMTSLLAGGFTEETARLLYAQGEEIAIFVMLQLVALVVKTNAVNGVQSNDGHPSEPSGSVAVFLKLPRKKRRKNRARSRVPRVRAGRLRKVSRLLRCVAPTAAAS
jgi:hypothetical protein